MKEKQDSGDAITFLLSVNYLDSCTQNNRAEVCGLLAGQAAWWGWAAGLNCICGHSHCCLGSASCLVGGGISMPSGSHHVGHYACVLAAVSTVSGAIAGPAQKGSGRRAKPHCLAIAPSTWYIPFVLCCLSHYVPFIGTGSLLLPFTQARTPRQVSTAGATHGICNTDSQHLPMKGTLYW